MTGWNRWKPVPASKVGARENREAASLIKKLGESKPALLNELVTVSVDLKSEDPLRIYLRFSM